MEVVFQLKRLLRSASLFKNIEVFFYISSSWVKVRLHTENQLARLAGSAFKVSAGWGGLSGCGVSSTALCGHTNFILG
jgi:hypothetical protein